MSTGEVNSGVVPSPSKDVAATEVNIPSWIFKASKWLFGLFGAAGVLYAVGYLVLASHFSMLGIWSDGSWSKADAVSEGARFFYQLVLFPASLTSWRGAGLIALVVIAVVVDLGPRLREAASKKLVPRIPEAVRGLRFPSVALVVAIALTGFLLETHLQVVSLDVSKLSGDVANNLVKPEWRGAMFSSLAGRSLLVVGIAWLLERMLWRNGSTIQRLAITLQWCAAIAAVLMLPVVYGRLLLPFDYPRFEHPALATKGTRMVLARTPEHWVLWNAESQVTELFPTKTDGIVQLGARRSILATDQKGAP